MGKKLRHQVQLALGFYKIDMLDGCWLVPQKKYGVFHLLVHTGCVYFDLDVQSSCQAA